MDKALAGVVIMELESVTVRWRLARPGHLRVRGRKSRSLQFLLTKLGRISSDKHNLLKEMAASLEEGH